MNKTITDVYLCKVPLFPDNKNQLTFTSLQSQSNYFAGKVVKEEHGCSYQRKDSYVRVHETYDDCIGCNYLFYNNGSKYYYHYITNVEYVSDDVTKLSIKTDPYQTFMFDIEIKESFVEREHIDDDTIGNNLLEEGLETGEYKFSAPSGFQTHASLDLCSDLCLLLAVTDSNTDRIDDIGGLYGNVYNGCCFYAYTCDGEGATYLTGKIESLCASGKAESIVAIATVPSKFVGATPTATGTKINNGVPFHTESVWINKNYDSLDGYHPRNNKLFCYPYNFCQITNNKGGNAVFRYEFMGSSEFKAYANIGLKASVILFPASYKNAPDNLDFGITLTDFPLGCWNNDVYANWYAQNKHSISVQTEINSLGVAQAHVNNYSAGLNAQYAIISGVTSAVSSVASLSAGGMLGGALSSVQAVQNQSIVDKQNALRTRAAHQQEESLLASLADHKTIPDQAAGNTYNGDLNTALKCNDFYLDYITIRQQYAQIIDGYFDRYGYKTLLLKVPNVTGRPNWNYVKTVDANIVGDVPSGDIEELKNILDNGCTFWHNPNTIYDYSQTNK